MDRNGRYVPLLRRENFRIQENGVEQKIAYFATTDSPFSVVLLIDTSGSTRIPSRRHSGRRDQVRRQTETDGQRDGDVV